MLYPELSKLEKKCVRLAGGGGGVITAAAVRYGISGTGLIGALA